MMMNPLTALQPTVTQRNGISIAPQALKTPNQPTALVPQALVADRFEKATPPPATSSNQPALRSGITWAFDLKCVKPELIEKALIDVGKDYQAVIATVLKSKPSLSREINGHEMLNSIIDVCLKNIPEDEMLRREEVTERVLGDLVSPAGSVYEKAMDVIFSSRSIETDNPTELKEALQKALEQEHQKQLLNKQPAVKTSTSPVMMSRWNERASNIKTALIAPKPDPYGDAIRERTIVIKVEEFLNNKLPQLIEAHPQIDWEQQLIEDFHHATDDSNRFCFKLSSTNPKVEESIDKLFAKDMCTMVDDTPGAIEAFN